MLQPGYDKNRFGPNSLTHETLVYEHSWRDLPSLIVSGKGACLSRPRPRCPPPGRCGRGRTGSSGYPAPTAAPPPG